MTNNQKTHLNNAKKIEEAAKANESDPDPSNVQEDEKRFTDQGITGSREDWKKNRNKYDG